MQLPWPLTLRAGGLLLLRLAVLVPLLGSAPGAPGVQGVLLWADMALLLLGLLTPVAALAAAALAVGAGPDALSEALAAVALALVGAGRLSLDAWLFGPRLIMTWPPRRR